MIKGATLVKSVSLVHAGLFSPRSILYNLEVSRCNTSIQLQIIPHGGTSTPVSVHVCVSQQTCGCVFLFSFFFCAFANQMYSQKHFFFFSTFRQCLARRCGVTTNTRRLCTCAQACTQTSRRRAETHWRTNRRPLAKPCICIRFLQFSAHPK